MYRKKNGVPLLLSSFPGYPSKFALQQVFQSAGVDPVFIGDPAPGCMELSTLLPADSPRSCPVFFADLDSALHYQAIPTLVACCIFITPKSGPAYCKKIRKRAVSPAQYVDILKRADQACNQLEMFEFRVRWPDLKSFLEKRPLESSYDLILDMIWDSSFRPFKLLDFKEHIVSQLAQIQDWTRQ